MEPSFLPPDLELPDDPVVLKQIIGQLDELHREYRRQLEPIQRQMADLERDFESGVPETARPDYERRVERVRQQFEQLDRWFEDAVRNCRATATGLTQDHRSKPASGA